MRFDFDFDPAYSRIQRGLGIGPRTAWVEVDGDDLRARFGRWHVHTPVLNVAGTDVTGPYAYWKTAGPPRLGVTDRGLTFATNGRRGLRIDFHDPVRGIDPFGLIRHPELTVTVLDCEGLAEALSPDSGREV